MTHCLTCLDVIEQVYGYTCRVSSFLTPASPAVQCGNVIHLTDEMMRTMRQTPASECTELLSRLRTITVPTLEEIARAIHIDDFETRMVALRLPS